MLVLSDHTRRFWHISTAGIFFQYPQEVRPLALQIGEHYRWTNANLGCEIEVTKGPAPGEGGTWPPCGCGNKIQKVGWDLVAPSLCPTAILTQTDVVGLDSGAPSQLRSAA
jgi:hypothetical protein